MMEKCLLNVKLLLYLTLKLKISHENKFVRGYFHKRAFFLG